MRLRSGVETGGTMPVSYEKCGDGRLRAEEPGRSGPKSVTIDDERQQRQTTSRLFLQARRTVTLIRFHFRKSVNATMQRRFMVGRRLEVACDCSTKVHRAHWHRVNRFFVRGMIGLNDNNFCTFCLFELFEQPVVEAADFDDGHEASDFSCFFTNVLKNRQGRHERY